MKQGKTQEQLNGMITRPYHQWFVGTGAQTEFFLEKTVLRIENIAVYVAGLRQRPNLNGAVYDFRVRGVTPGYDGDGNAITFTVAPVLNAAVLVDVLSP